MGRNAQRYSIQFKPRPEDWTCTGPGAADVFAERPQALTRENPQRVRGRI